MDKEKEHIITDKTMLRVTRVTSIVFASFSIPSLALLMLFLFSYFRTMPILRKGAVLGIVYCFAVLAPIITIFLFRKINRPARQELGEHKRRYVPTLLTIISYIFYLPMVRKLSIPWYMTGIIFVPLVIPIICILINPKWKLNKHMAGMGGIIGGLVSFNALFSYNPVARLCLFILTASAPGSARTVLGRHALGEVLSDSVVGLVCSFLILHPAYNLISRVFLF